MNMATVDETALAFVTEKMIELIGDGGKDQWIRAPEVVRKDRNRSTIGFAFTVPDLRQPGRVASTFILRGIHIMSKALKKWYRFHLSMIPIDKGFECKLIIKDAGR